MTNGMDRGLLLQRCWGKAQDEDPEHYHPVLSHMIDVAAVALELMDLPAHARRTALLLRPSADAEVSRESVGFLVALHDLGKVSPGFQSKAPALAARLQELGLPFEVHACRDHSRVGAATLGAHLEDLGLDEDCAWPAAHAVAAHHGATPSQRRLSPMEHGGDEWEALRREVVIKVAAVLPPGPLVDVDEADDRWLALLAGLTSVADWIGSDTTYFPYRPTENCDAEALRCARGRARAALKALGWTGWDAIEPPRPFARLFPFPPRPLQAAVERLAPEASLLIVEAPTGTGKTEAALAAAEQWTAGQGGAGLYIALPTQATSNQMVQRIRRFLARRYPADRVNLHLAHGGAGLDPTYRRLRARSVDGIGDAEGGVVADAWFCARKRPLLAPFGVGTVDQIMLGALQCRHGLVRLYGLAGKVIVIDEIHAYDAFMSRIIGRLLMWLRSLDCRVLLLSATLPRPQRAALLRAWGAEPPSESAAYPCITSVSDSGAARTLGVSDEHRPPRTVRLTWGPPANAPQEVAQMLVGALAHGGCGVWICNTVVGAQSAARALWQAGWAEDDTTVFHARFPTGDRVEIERQLLARFGPDGDRPARHIVVATQVIEQSLDIDFDVMATEVAPIDLIVQRAGRLWRHDRKRSLEAGGPVLILLAPENGPSFGASELVYHPHVLLRTWLTLQGREAWRDPQDIPGLVAGVYDAEATVPPEFAERWHETRAALVADRRRQAAAAATGLVPPPREDGDLLDAISRALDDDLEAAGGFTARTRDIGESVRLICLYAVGDGGVGLHPGARPLNLLERPDGGLLATLLRRAVSVSSPGWVRRLARLDLPAAWRRVGALRGARMLVLDTEGRMSLESCTVELHPRLGLCLSLTRTAPS